MKELPVLFSGAMVRKILSGEKTQTRRPIKPQPPDILSSTIGLDSAAMSCWVGQDAEGQGWRARCPLGEQGKTALWVRESCWIAPPGFGDADLTTHTDPQGRRRLVTYSAGMDGESVRCAKDYGVKQTPSIHMPRWASRIVLKVTDVRVQRAKSITEADAMAEGAKHFPDLPRGPMDAAYPYPGYVSSRWSMFDPPNTDHCLSTARYAFGNAWDLIYGFGSWDSNPWVWAVTFERVEQKAASNGEAA